MKFKLSHKNKGFTLLEILLSLLIFSLIMQTTMTVYKSYSRIETEIRADTSADFLHFLALIESELALYYVTGTGNQTVFLNHIESNLSKRIILNNNKIYITPGHQPLLYKVKNWNVVQINSQMSIVVTFTNDEVHHGLVTIQPSKE